MPDLGSLLRVVVSLGLVLALLWVAARALQKGRAGTARGVDVDVLARLPLAQKSSLAVVRLGDQALVLGVTESRVALLCQAPAADLAVEPESSLTDVLAVAASQTTSQTTSQSPSHTTSFTQSHTTSPVPASRVAARQAARSSAAAGSGIAGSALSPQTWAKAVAAVREMTVRQ
jgi:flagellar protein FliO/FliZ